MEKIQLMDIKRQYIQHSEEFDRAVLQVLHSGIYIGGKSVEEFETEFAKKLDIKYAISVGSGTDALIIALRSVGIGQGDEVITPALTFFATAESISAVGAKPVFVDVCEDTYCIDPEKIESAITVNTKAILPVHFYGHSADLNKIVDIAHKHNLYVIEDCAQAAGTMYHGKYAGTFGDVACFSFFPTKNLGCAGDGGMIVTNNDDIRKACLAYKVHGSGINGLYTLEKQYKKWGQNLPINIPRGATKYYNYLIGYNSRLDAIQAALLSVKLKYLDEYISKRRANAKTYNEALCVTEFITPFEAPNCIHSYYIYALRHPRAADIMKKLEDSGIGTGVYYPVPMHFEAVYHMLGYKKGDMPVTEKLVAELFAVPIYPELEKSEIDFIISTLKEAF